MSLRPVADSSSMQIEDNRSQESPAPMQSTPQSSPRAFQPRGATPAFLAFGRNLAIKISTEAPLCQAEQKEETSPIQASNVSTPDSARNSALYQQAMRGLESGLKPERLESTGRNGTYRVFGLTNRYRRQNTIAIFKPAEESLGYRPAAAAAAAAQVEDPHANQRGCREGILPEESPMMERVGYLLGKRCHVPETIFTRLASDAFASNDGIQFCNEGALQRTIEKTGSLQKFIPNGKPARDFSAAELSQMLKKIDQTQLQRLAFLDILSFNTDRNRGNLLFDEKKGLLIPIDHGCIAPRHFGARASSLCWMDWEELNAPFNPKLLREINWEASREEIVGEFPNFPQGSLATLEVCHHLLKSGIALEFSPRELGCFLSLYRSFFTDCTPLKHLYNLTGDKTKMMQQLDLILPLFKKFCVGKPTTPQMLDFLFNAIEQSSGSRRSG
jgi:hypothetical protein